MPNFDIPTSSPISDALDHVRQMVALCRRSCDELVSTASCKPVRAVGVVGAGIMGASIALEHALHGVPVVMLDSNPETLRRAAAVIDRELSSSGQATVSYCLSEADLIGCDLVIETITERRPAKQALYARLESCLPPDTLLATNTSTIPIGRLASGLKTPERFGGLHYCHPVPLRPLIEIIPGPATADSTLSTLVAHARHMGKLPLVVADGPGFVVNRLLLTYLNAALGLAVVGCPIAQLDAAMRRFGMPLGPIEMLDEIGLDTALQSGMVLSEILGDRSDATQVLVRLVKSGNLGCKSGAGFYTYPEKSTNPSAGQALQACLPGSAPAVDPESIASRLLDAVLAEAERLIAEKKVAAGWQIDLALIFGLGHPLWRGGLLWSAKQNGGERAFQSP